MKANKRAWEAYTNWRMYMNEIYAARKDEVRSGKTREGLDLMGALIRGAGMTKESLSSRASDAEKGGSGQLLTDDEILGNMFVFILAGHETTANTIHFSMLYLAMHWSSQARLHKDLDEIFGNRPVDEWDYEHDVPKLFGSMAGAVMNEVLRLVPPVAGIPKSTQKDSPQPITVNGRRCVVPGGTVVNIISVATARNPKYWPTILGPNPTEEEVEDDLNSFKPERWLLDSSSNHNSTASAHQNGSANHSDNESEKDSDHALLGGPQSSDTSSALLKPHRGAYVPFSEGYRACLGRRFAQVEVLAVLAVLFREYSIELAVDEFASDEEVEAMDEEGRKRVWTQARDRAEDLLKNGMGTIITLQMRGGKVPLRFVRRGKERFRMG